MRSEEQCNTALKYDVFQKWIFCVSRLANVAFSNFLPYTNQVTSANIHVMVY